MTESLSSHNEVQYQLDLLMKSIRKDLEKHSSTILDLRNHIDDQFNHLTENMDESVAMQFLKMKHELSRSLINQKEEKTNLMRRIREMSQETVQKYTSFKDALTQLTNLFSKESINNYLQTYGPMIDKFRALDNVNKMIYGFRGITSSRDGEEYKEKRREIQETNFYDKFKNQLPDNELHNYINIVLSIMFYEIFLNLPPTGKFEFYKNRNLNDQRET